MNDFVLQKYLKKKKELEMDKRGKKMGIAQGIKGQNKEMFSSSYRIFSKTCNFVFQMTL